MSILNTPQDPRHQVANPLQQGLFRSVPLAAVVLGFAVVAFYYGDLPARIPIHFNGAGQVDGYGPKYTLWLLPVINLLLFYGLEAATRANFKWFNYPVKITPENASVQHEIALQLLAVVRLLVTLLLAWITYATVMAALRPDERLNGWIIGGFLLALFGAIIYYMVEANKSK